MSQAATLPYTEPQAPKTPDFETLVGPDGWYRLPPDIRRRFTEKPTTTAPIHYRGLMRRVECSKLGWLLAQICRLIRTPFAPATGADVPCAITLRHERGGGIIWDREYQYPGRKPALVTSTKRNAPDGALCECVGGGFGMRLAVFEAGHQLHFLSLRYFWRIGAWEFTLPRLLTPGTAHVIHADLGGGRFRFTMTIHHPIFGMLFEQDGEFEKVTHRNGEAQ